MHTGVEREVTTYRNLSFAHSPALQIAANRRALLRLRAADTLLGVLRVAFGQARPSYQAAAQSLLLILGQVVAEQAALLDQQHAGPLARRPLANADIAFLV